MPTTRIPPSLLEIHEYEGPGFQALVNFPNWRVALLNFTTELIPERIDEIQRHNETDEVFILLKGRCILFLGEGDDPATSFFAQDLEPFHLYNVRRGAWHTHALSVDAKVLIVENQNTSPANSPRVKLTADQRNQIIGLCHQLWGDEVFDPIHRLS